MLFLIYLFIYLSMRPECITPVLTAAHLQSNHRGCMLTLALNRALDITQCFCKRIYCEAEQEGWLPHLDMSQQLVTTRSMEFVPRPAACTCAKRTSAESVKMELAAYSARREKFVLVLEVRKCKKLVWPGHLYFARSASAKV